MVVKLNKRHIALCVAVAVIVAVGLGVWLFKPRSQVNENTGYSEYSEKIQELTGEPAPSEPLERAQYFGQLAQSYEGTGNINAAIEHYKKAQQVIDEHNLSAQFVFYLALANAYHQKKDTAQEKENLQKYLSHLQAVLQAQPDDGGATLEAIQSVELRLQNI